MPHAAYWPSDSYAARVAAVYCSTVIGGVPLMSLEKVVGPGEHTVLIVTRYVA